MTGYKDTAKIVEEVLDIQARRIKELLKEWDLTGMTLIFIGGTSKLLQKQLKKYFGKDIFIPDDANLINSRGFLKAMLEGYGYKAKI